MSRAHIQHGSTEPIEAKFVDGAGAGVTGLSPTILIWRATGDKFWNGTGYVATPPTPLAMTAVDAANLPGEYAYSFVTTNATEENHWALASSGSTSIVNDGQLAEIVVGGFVDHLDTPTSAVGLADGAIGGLTLDLDALANIKGEAQAALTTQGYTTPRAVALDNLNVSSQSIVDGQTDTLEAIAALPAAPSEGANADAVWEHVAGLLLINHVSATAWIDTEIDAGGWVERRFVRSGALPDVTETERYALYAQDGTRITNAAPPAGVARMIARRVRVEF